MSGSMPFLGVAKCCLSLSEFRDPLDKNHFMADQIVQWVLNQCRWQHHPWLYVDLISGLDHEQIGSDQRLLALRRGRLTAQRRSPISKLAQRLQPGLRCFT
ncbi:hypothetical protein [Nocardia fluminea]|uniref:hypothetical protein n=1 Tax=Nocardia fluminea TaxID=134984 RepID=UPI00341CF5C4